MEKHQQHGVVVTEITRPDPQVVAGFARHDIAKIGDAMARHGLVDPRIKPVASGMRVLGPAVTVLTRPGDALYVAHAADVAQPGDVIVIDAGGFDDLAVIGDRIAYYMMRIRELGGVVVNGAIRDLAGIRNLGFPTFANGVAARLQGSSGPGAINIPIVCGGVLVNPGDIVVGDDDGVVIVPREDAQRTLDLSDEHLAGELARLDQVNAGMSLTEVQGLGPRLDIWR
jgi:regulator of RNase E activity RraA